MPSDSGARSPEALRKPWAGRLPALAVAVLLSVFFIREMSYISYSSPTYDEGYYLTYGYSLLKTGDWRLANDKPNLVPLLTALPLLATEARLDTGSEHWKNLETGRAYTDIWLFTLEFLHKNVIPADKVMFYARLPVVFLALLLGLAVYAWSERLYGRTAGLFSLLLYTTCPNILAHAGLATEDMAFTVFSFLTLYFYSGYNLKKGPGGLLLTGAALGLALNTKHTAMLLLPALAVCRLSGSFPRGGTWKGLKRGCLELGAVAAAAVLILLPFYGIASVGQFFSGLMKTTGLVESGHTSFLNGTISTAGFWYYFIYAFLVKTPLSILIFAGIAAAVKIKERGFSGDGVYLAFFPALLFLAASFSGFNVGLRHVLPVYPFLFVFCGGAVGLVKGRTSLFAGAALLLWQVLASASVHPYYLTYFNGLAGGPRGGHEHLLDSNLDWGQDLKGLKRYLEKENVSDLILSNFGSTVPGYIGRDFQDLFSTMYEKSGHVNGLAPSKEYLAVSATNLHGVYFREFGKDMFYWLRGKEPKAVIGNNIRVYDITSDAGAHEHLANVYFLTGNPKQAERECRRALILDPRSRRAAFLLALVRMKEKNSEADGLALLRAYLRENGFTAPPSLPEFMPAPLFRYRYFIISNYAARKFTGTKNFKEAAAMSGLAEHIKGIGAGGKAEIPAN
jgi:4-amino-4-deoxy-L-arabinose transferase-like glycosyltransferase